MIFLGCLQARYLSVVLVVVVDSKGFCPIHSACSLCLKDPQNSSIATEIVRMMTSVGADVSVVDSNGNTPLHWAARSGDKSTAEFLLLKASPKGKRDENTLSDNEHRIFVTGLPLFFCFQTRKMTKGRLLYTGHFERVDEGYQLLRSCSKMEPNLLYGVKSLSVRLRWPRTAFMMRTILRLS